MLESDGSLTIADIADYIDIELIQKHMDKEYIQVLKTWNEKINKFEKK